MLVGLYSLSQYISFPFSTPLPYSDTIYNDTIHSVPFDDVITEFDCTLSQSTYCPRATG